MITMGEYRQRAVGAMAIGMLLAAGSGCGEPFEMDPRWDQTAVSVRDGRLVFADVQAFSDVINQLSENQAESPASLAQAFPGFRPLRAADPEAGWSPAIQSILNDDRMYQIGSELFVMDAGLEYVLPESSAWIVEELRHGASAQDFAAAGLIRVYGLNRRSSERQGIVDTGAQSLLSSKYQYPFQTNTHAYKYVDEAYVDVYANYVNVCFRAKFEYYKGARPGWEPAGERVYKQIGTVSPFDGTPGFGGAYITGNMPRIDLLGKRQEDSSNLTLCRALVPAVGSCISDLQLHAEFYSQVSVILNAPAYRPSADWSTEFVNISKCNYLP